MEKSSLDIQADYYYDLLMHYIKESNDYLCFTMQAVNRNTDILNYIHKAIYDILSMGREYLLTKDYLIYITSIIRTEAKDYLWNIREHLLDIKSPSDEVVISEFFSYYDHLYRIKYRKEINFHTVTGPNESLIVNVKLKNNMLYINKHLETLSDEFDIQIKSIITATLEMILSYCTFMKEDFIKYNDFINNILKDPYKYVDKLIVNGICEYNHDNYSEELFKTYYIRLLNYVIEAINNNTLESRAIR